ncbi:MAG: 3-beta hydroxysteroid dehydrogenase/isomerase [Cyanobacteria bacterium RYN_339]|nr:3-beta hydroxysteroid dehydrogenase/isomerase [Cyanobacteria bacterium RYN_339]
MKALVTGGGGFLGGAIIDQLLARGDQVRSFQRGDYPALAAKGVEVVKGDVADAAAVIAACEGIDVVFHVAAKAGAWGPYAEYHRANVGGTRNVLAGCRAHGVRKLVYTSSPSVVFGGGDMEGADESVPYASHYEAPYPATKAEAERAVLASNGPDLATVALRPHLIWGPGDTNITPRLIARAKAGRLRKIGADKLVDATYIDNAAHAHLLAADRLGPEIAGKAYFIANDEPMPAFDLVNGILDAAGLPPVTSAVPLGLAYAIGGLLEGVHGLFNLPGEPVLTRWTARELGTAHWFDLGAAKRDLGYVPLVSTQEGLQRLKASFT